MGATATASARMELRMRPESKSLIEHAAALVSQPVSEFVRTTLEKRAAEVVAEHEAYTRVPAEFFDDMLAALDAPACPSKALARAARRARHTVSRA